MKREFTHEERVRGYERSSEVLRQKAEVRIEAILSSHEPSKYTRTLKRILIELLGEKCSECGCASSWNGKPLTLELDHIDGDSMHNHKDNLRLLCPNCHSQTDTYRAKNKGNSTREYTMVPKQRGVSQRSSKP